MDGAGFYEPSKISFTIFGPLHKFILNLQFALETKLTNVLEFETGRRQPPWPSSPTWPT